MNQNIEVINSHLWAVKFSWLPWISDINIKVDPEYSSEEQALAVSDDDIVVLNKDNPIYPTYRTFYPRFQRQKPKVLKQLLKDFEAMPKRTNIQELQKLMIQLELERRKGREGKANGNHSKRYKTV